MDASASRARAFRTAVGAAALACCAALATGCTTPVAQAGPDTTAAARTAAPMTATDLQSRYQQLVKEVLPSVVQIQASHDLGSGVVYDDKGHIVTNAHVVGSEKTFQVTTANSEDPLTASLVYSYPEQDLAVIKLDRMPDGLRPAVFGDSEKVEVGHIVLAMGSPLGLSSSVTQGIVSATGRTVSEGSTGWGSPRSSEAGSAEDTGATIANMVQTSAAINPGNSGGALVGLDGRVIGIPTLAAADPSLGGGAAPGIGFAIPVSMVRTVADQIIEKGKVVDSGRAALGITVRTVVDDGYRPAGVAVVSVRGGGAADRAGLRPGDIVTRLGDEPVTTVTSLSEALAADRPGRRTSVTYQRNGTGKTVEVTLGEQ
ncbi:S1C family serine protease [Streptomyces sp. SP2-10]|uniref:S1C family serine protease n=1 Tax=Streptomyces sp. SP2-10 TaxID=2873385 RepID=UPI001CA6D71D|nr:trypsin-like peptidase domain-containing protein [Streptomyces sp. SP2-10]MBY8844367.1 trypsin-like peptidase domain-containing protein [Streptomyces sp. SP2-10]